MLNTEVRDDALNVFITGLKKSLRAVVFPAQPYNLPAALALAREVEASIEQSMFAATYAKAVEQGNQNTDFHKSQHRAPKKQGKNFGAERGPEKPHYFKKPNKNQNTGSCRKHNDWAPDLYIDQSSSKRRHPTNFRQGSNIHVPKRPNFSERNSGQRRQRVFKVEQAAKAEEEDDHKNAAAAALNGWLAGRVLKILIDTGAAKNYIKTRGGIRSTQQRNQVWKCI